MTSHLNHQKSPEPCGALCYGPSPLTAVISLTSFPSVFISHCCPSCLPCSSHTGLLPGPQKHPRASFFSPLPCPQLFFLPESHFFKLPLQQLPHFYQIFAQMIHSSKIFEHIDLCLPFLLKFHQTLSSSKTILFLFILLVTCLLTLEYK